MSNTMNRRDFLGGTALVIAAGLTPLAQMRAGTGGYYPPSLTGLRGSHPGSFEVAHQVGREGRAFDTSGLAVEENFDLVVVGGGISGLAAHAEPGSLQCRAVPSGKAVAAEYAVLGVRGANYRST